MRNKLFSVTAFLFLFSASTPSYAESSNVTVFPPANKEAGGGMLYFPKDSTQSLYAVPVQNDPALIQAINDQTAALKELAKTKDNGRYQISCGLWGGALACATIDTRTGATCRSGYGQGPECIP